MRALTLFLFLLCFLSLPSRAGEPLFGPKEPVEFETTLIDDPYGFFVEGFTVGLFPTSANDPEPLDLDGSFSAGGGASVGYRFNGVLALRVGGQMIRADSVWIEDIHADVLAYLPRGVSPDQWLPDLVKIPDFASAQFYLVIGGGAQHSVGGWDSLLRAGVGVEMPLTENIQGVNYMLEAVWNVVGIGTNDENLDPYPTIRTGIRLAF